ncbi:MAG TPA: metal ABC transporter permease [Sedimentisphaerales bacterium]|nr:metal ABC transporter permease [Phycisphaerae bacterium]HON92294.1 metal ABC transporter permease [Sedimentisphaerales bacterium]HQI29076.1 metal ABC transporter permease [Sedimentisphaerales bacterium]
MDPFFYSILLAGVIAGASCGLLGVYIVGLRLPFVGVFVSHTAMAGAVYSYLLGLNPVLGATSISAVTAMSLAAIRPGRTRVDSNVALAILFSLMLGVTFLGIGLIQDSRTEILGLLWGSILFVRRENIIVLSTAAAVLVLFTILFNKELKALLFSRSIALATGVHETFVYAMFLALCGVILAVNLPLIGGLMIFSLISNPAAAAYQLCRGHRAIVVTSVALGVLSTAGGFFISYFLNLPTGACIVLASTLVFALSAGYRSFSGRKD